MNRKLIASGALLCASWLPATAQAVPVQPNCPTVTTRAPEATTIADQLTSELNDYRVSKNVGVLPRASDLDAIAQAYAEHLASLGMDSPDHRLHNPNLAAQLAATGHYFRLGGENLGNVDPSQLELLTPAWIASPTHEWNMSFLPWTDVGFGVVIAPTRVWVVVEFRDAYTPQCGLRTSESSPPSS